MHKSIYLFLSLFISSCSNISAEEIQFSQIIFIKTNKEKVWKALVGPAIVKKYFLCPLKKIGSATGEDIIYGNNKEDFISGKILSFKPNEELSHTFKFLSPNHEGTEKDNTTKVSYTIKEQEGVVQLTLVHNGFKEKNQSFYNVTGGWPYILSNLKTFLESGKALHDK